jgi:hypothetical protein
MSERFPTRIRIGGRIERSRVEPLLKAIREASVQTDWGEPSFQPKTPEELLEARKDGYLQLCDEEALGGQLPQLQQACHRLGLGYRRHCEGVSIYDAELTDWRPSMKDPIAHTSSNEHRDDILILGSQVRKAIALLETGDDRQGIDALKRLCPDIADLPPFEIV